MKMNTLLIAAALAFSIAAPSIAEAKCGKILDLKPNSTFDVVRKGDRVVGYPGKLVNGEPVYQVVIQNQKTCKVSRKVMDQDQLYYKYDIADELETGCVEGCD